MRYIVISTAVVDVIHRPGERTPYACPGGAGLYALCGVKLWADDALLLTGVGEDWQAHFGDWFEKNNLAAKGLMIRDAHTPVNDIVYAADGERTETARHGSAHYRRMLAQPADLAPWLAEAEGVYAFRDDDPIFWEELIALKEKHRFRLMWELNADAAVPERLEAVRRIARRVDALSLNRTEATAMLGTRSLGVAARMLAGWGLPLVCLRDGARGVLVIADGRVSMVPSVPDALAADVTGGGNASTAGMMVGLCKGESAVQIGRRGNLSAEVCIAQPGPPARLDGAMRALAAERLQTGWTAPPRADLHLHTTASDGRVSPSCAVRHAAQMGLDIIAITDHDTLSGVAEAVAEGDACGVRVLPAVELAVGPPEEEVHLLGYGISLDSGVLGDFMRAMREARREQVLAILERLSAMHMPVRAEDLGAAESMGRGNLAYAMVRAGYCATTEEAFARYIGKSGCAYVRRKRPSVKEAIRALHASGAVAVVAHPGKMRLSQEAFSRRLDAWHAADLDGVEAYHESHTAEQAQCFDRMARERGLLITGGSDWHGRPEQDVEVGDHLSGWAQVEWDVKALLARI